MLNVYGWSEYLILNSVTGVVLFRSHGLKHSPSNKKLWISPSERSEVELWGAGSQVGPCFDWHALALQRPPLSSTERFLGMNSASGSRSGCHVELKTGWSFLPPSSSVHQLLITTQGRAVISRSRSTKLENDAQTGKMPADLIAFTWNGNNEGNIDLIKIKFNYTQATGRRVLFEEMSLQNYLIADLAHNDTKGFIKYIYKINYPRF